MLRLKLNNNNNFIVVGYIVCSTLQVQELSSMCCNRNHCIGLQCGKFQ